jgi:hypothetical protein
VTGQDVDGIGGFIPRLPHLPCTGPTLLTKPRRNRGYDGSSALIDFSVNVLKYYSDLAQSAYNNLFNIPSSVTEGQHRRTLWGYRSDLGRQ